MATMNIDASVTWSYNANGGLKKIATFKNPSSSEKAEISSISLYLGTAKGTMNDGDTVTGDGKAINTYLQISGKNSNTVTVTTVINPKLNGNNNKYYPNRANFTTAYTFNFSPVISVGAGASVDININTLTQPHVLCMNAISSKNNGKSISITYRNIPNKQSKPTSATISLQNNTSYDATSISWKVSVSNATNYALYIDNIRQKEFSTSTLSNTSTVSSAKHTLYIDAWNGNSDHLKSNTITVDCTTPPIFNASITPTSINSGTLNFSSTYNIYYYLDNKSVGTLTVPSIGTNTKASKTVTLNNNSLSNYTLLVKRTDNEKITNSTIISNVDTTVTNLILNYEIVGLTLKYVVTANKSCTTWKYYLKNNTKNISTSGILYTSSTTRISGSLPDTLIVGDNYTLYVTAVNPNNGLISTSNIVVFIVPGVARIYIPEKNAFVAATVYVYNSSQGGWKVVNPYIYEDNWKICT